MYVEQLYTNCLAQAAYYVESNGEAAIIDPLREVQPYIDLAAARGAKIKYVLETHFHADFVSSHTDLAKKTGATVVYGPNAKAGYDIHVAKDGERLHIGDVTIEVLHTPGHTMESSCYLLYNPQGKPEAIFTGDTLFNGDVGRPDLAVKSGEITSEHLAGLLYDSLQTKIMPLPNELTLYPGHGAGSSCGKSMSKETVSTIGEQKNNNYALQPMTREQFIEAVLEGQEAPPKYFFHAAKINMTGIEAIDEVMARNAQALSVGELEAAVQRGALLLDARAPAVFSEGFVPGAINIGLDGQYAVWVGTMLDETKEIVLVADPGREEEAVLRLARVGYENVSGYLQGGVQAWLDAGRSLDSVTNMPPEALAGELNKGYEILDVRKPNEHASGVVKGAQLLPLDKLNEMLPSLDPHKAYLVHCAGGYRSMIAASMLKKGGIANVTNILKGYNGIKEVSPEITAVPQLV